MTNTTKKHIEHALDHLERGTDEYVGEHLRYMNMVYSIGEAHQYALSGEKDELNKSLRNVLGLMEEQDQEVISLEVERIGHRYRLEQEGVDTSDWN